MNAPYQMQFGSDRLKFSSYLAASILALATAQAVHAQEADGPELPEASTPAPAGNTIVVQGTRMRGELDVDQPPIAEYDAEDIAAFGAGSIADLIEAIAPATDSGARGGRGGGRPVFLVNGLRVSSFREIRSYPPEAVAKVEVFPEEVAQRFGYSADQRVVNIVLKPDFRSVTAEIEYEQPDRGGYSRSEQEATFLRIGEQGRLNFTAEVEDQSLLTEAERGLAVAAAPGEAPFRSLLPDTLSAEASANYTRVFLDSGTSVSANATYEREQSRSLSGLSTDGTIPLARRSSTDSFVLGGTANTRFGDWDATYTLDAIRALGETEIDRNGGEGFDIARSRTWTIDNKMTLVGRPLLLPAGEVTMTIDIGLDWKRIASEDTRATDDLSLTRRRIEGGVNVSIPVAERGAAWGAVGDVSVNLTAGAEELSDFGVLANWSAGMNWSPFDNLGLSVTRIWREVAPSLTQLGAPRIDEFNVPVFDYASGETVLATVITGGNPDLRAETQADWKISANWELPFWENTRLQLDYGINRSRDVTSTPGFGAAFEQAFPERVTRDGDGALLAIDRRPLTFYETRSRVLSFGLNTRGRIGAEPAAEAPRDRGNASGGTRAGTTGGRAFDPARREAVRAAICADPPELDGLGEAMLARLRNEDGAVDPTKLEAMRARMCSADGAQMPGQGQTNADGRGGGRGRGMRFGPGGDGDRDTRPRYFLSFNHTIALENEILLAPGGPLFDQLDGEVLGGGAINRHGSQLEGGIFWQGYGFRLSGRYIGDARLRGSGLPGSSDLFFGDLATFDLRLFADLGEVFGKEDGWLKGLRVSLLADNVFDARRSVVDANGLVPEAYAPFRIDPTGRYLGFEVRKAF